MTESDKPLQIGELLDPSECGGFIEGDPFGLVRIEAIGVDWVITRQQDTGVVYAALGSSHEPLKKGRV
jgi:hypothetical protein